MVSSSREKNRKSSPPPLLRPRQKQLSFSIAKNGDDCRESEAVDNDYYFSQRDNNNDAENICLIKNNEESSSSSSSSASAYSYSVSSSESISRSIGRPSLLEMSSKKNLQRRKSTQRRLNSGDSHGIGDEDHNNSNHDVYWLRRRRKRFTDVRNFVLRLMRERWRLIVISILLFSLVWRIGKNLRREKMRRDGVAMMDSNFEDDDYDEDGGINVDRDDGRSRNDFYSTVNSTEDLLGRLDLLRKMSNRGEHALCYVSLINGFDINCKFFEFSFS